MKKWFTSAALAISLCAPPLAHAKMPVIDVANLAQTTMSALQSLKTEIYENTNIAYQYKMMANQLLQATGMDPSHLAEQLGAISDDIRQYEAYGSTLKDLYGSVSDTVDYFSKVQSMVKASGKTIDDWFSDQRQLLQSGDKTARMLFDLGTNVAKNVQNQAKRREKVQKTMKLTGTAQAAAEATNEMLDILATQNSDLLQLMSARAQADAARDKQGNAYDTEKTEAMQAIARDQETQLQQLRSRVYTREWRAE
ncbi:conjugal transfer protein TrbJ [Cupriavidus sp. AU9028]|uniref:conjugal transfer protein TrbJ n=1 Tax=Cupriavidus sp. AU9028 TaxID=2871157 RepID=UPI001C97FFEF|nr:conjugal transfer protein TrbJ [Cupriavidus sp. AU9028]MBY4898639.1 conjugal transfer protein TrbJ [Cupriavidus sp. AU9028]